MENRDLISKWGEILRDHVNTKFSKRYWAMSHVKTIEEEYAKVPKINTNEEALNCFKRILEKNNNKKLLSFVKELTREKYFYLGQSWPPYRILSLIHQLDYEIVVKNGIQYLRKK